MLKDILSTLLTSGAILLGAILLGAIIGFLGAYVGNIQALKLAKEQIRYDREHELQGKALATAFSLLWELQEATAHWADTPLTSTAWAQRSAEVADKNVELSRSYRRDALFIPIDVFAALTETLASYLAQQTRLKNAATASKDHYEQVSQEVARWLDTEGTKRITNLQITIRREIGLEHLTAFDTSTGEKVDRFLERTNGLLRKLNRSSGN